MKRRLPVLCPQEYEGATTMRVVPCTRCSAGWDAPAKRCSIAIGVEHLPIVPAAQIPVCPLEARCQHQRQSHEPCPVRARGLICESALTWAGVPNVENHPLGFNAMVCA